MLDRYPNDVKYVVKHFPLPSHRFANKAAMATLAAGNQGKYWEFHTTLLENYNKVNDEKIQEVAAGLGLDMDRFQQDLKAESSQKLIRADVAHGRKIGVGGTPSLFMNGKKVNNRKLGNLPQLVQQELNRLSKGSPSP